MVLLDGAVYRQLLHGRKPVVGCIFRVLTLQPEADVSG
jgi:hypothetical protein